MGPTVGQFGRWPSVVIHPGSGGWPWSDPHQVGRADRLFTSPRHDLADSTCSIIIASCVRERIPSFRYTFERWYSTVARLMKSCPAMSWLVAP